MNDLPTVIPVEDFPAKVVFSTMQAGNVSPNWETSVGDAATNLRLVKEQTDLLENQEIHMRSQHADKVLMVGGEEFYGRNVDCDAMVTTEKGLVLSLFPADCFPIVITGVDTSFLALIHAGWIGVDLRIVEKVVTLLNELLGQNPSDLTALVGPGIRSCCYRTPTVANQLQDSALWKPFIADSDRVDLAGYIRKQLVDSGLTEEKIVDLELCTNCSTSSTGETLFFSNLRDSKTTTEGRFAVLTAI